MRAGLAAAGLALALAAPAAQAAFPGTNGVIAFSSDRSGDHEIYTMRADGSNLVRLTNSPGNDGGPRYSPDGTRIVFSSERDGNPEIYVMNADGSGQTRLTNEPAPDVGPSFSPDGGRIAFSSGREGENRQEIYVMNADGSAQTKVTETPPNGGVPGISSMSAWGPDGRIAFASFRNLEQIQVYLMNADGSGQTRLTNDPGGALLPAWSPDARRIAFFGTRESNGELFAINADGSGQVQLTSAPGEDVYPAFSPDGTKIVFTSTRDDARGEIYLMNPDGSGQTRLTNDPSTDAGPDWQPAPVTPPVLGEAVNVAVVSGTVLVDTGPGGFVPLTGARQVPVGAQLDTRQGTVRLTSASDRSGRTQTGDFRSGRFQVRQAKQARAVTELRLRGASFARCRSGRSRRASASQRRRTIRRVFAKAKGRFRTRGRYSSATVRGTTWLTSDRCDGTLTTVTSGSVNVRDFRRLRTVRVQAGRSYLARALR